MICNLLVPKTSNNILFFSGSSTSSNPIIGENPSLGNTSTSQQSLSLVQNLETLLESVNSGNWQNVDWGQMQSVMENMQGLDASSFGVDPAQWQELTQSFNQLLNAQGIQRNLFSTSNQSFSSNSTGSLSSHSGNGYTGQNFMNLSPGSASHLSAGSFVGSGSPGTSAGSYHSTGSVPGIRVTPPNYNTGIPRRNVIEEEEEEDEFDWSTIM